MYIYIYIYIYIYTYIYVRYLYDVFRHFFMTLIFQNGLKGKRRVGNKFH